MKIIHLLAPLALAAALAFDQGVALAASPEKGKAAYLKNGCWQCHGFAAQGGTAGPKLAPDPKPVEYYSVFVRNSAGSMPPYPAAILSNEDLADIHAWLRTIPKPADYRSIPLLNQ